MLLLKRIIVVMCAKNYKSKFKFAKVIQKKSVDSFSGHVHLSHCASICKPELY